MVKKSKKVEVNNLYNFNAHDEDELKKNKKSKSKKKVKKVAPKKKSNVEEKKENKENKFTFDEEIVIGLAKIEPEADKKAKKNKKKNKQKKINKKVNTSTKNNLNENKSNKKYNNSNKKNKERERNNNNKNKEIESNKKQEELETDYLTKTKSKKKSKKRLSPEEQEMRRKKIERNLKITKYAFLTACILSAIIATMASPLFNIKEIKVEGNSKLTTNEIISISQIQTDENIYKTSIKKAKEKILENPYIKSVTVKRNLPSTVTITVEERKATYMIEYGSGYVYINNQGYILEVSNDKIEVPILQGCETTAEELVPGKRLVNADLEKLSTVIKIMEVATDNDMQNLITRIDMQNKQNYKIVLETEEKVAYLGDDTDLTTKLLSIKSIVEKEKGIAGEIFVNMDLKNSYPTFRQSV